MTPIKLTTRRIEKVWGRHKLTPWFPDAPDDGEPVGEIWFEMPGVPADVPELLVKFLFTSEKLSIQVHPDDAAAQAAGYPRGKDEAWVVLDVEPGASIGLGLTRKATREELRAGALDGSIEALVDWRPAKAGDVIYSPAGTVHALGPGLAIVEIQQNVDLTYRLYDYGRPRELHLDAGIAVSDPEPFKRVDTPRDLGEGRTELVDGPAFRLERWQGGGVTLVDGPAWLVVLAGRGAFGGGIYGPGEVWYSEGGSPLERSDDSELLVAYPRIA